MINIPLSIPLDMLDHGAPRPIELLLECLLRLDRSGYATFEPGELLKLRGRHWKRDIDMAVAWGLIHPTRNPNFIQPNQKLFASSLPVRVPRNEINASYSFGMRRGFGALVDIAKLGKCPQWFVDTMWAWAYATKAEDGRRCLQEVLLTDSAGRRLALTPQTMASSFPTASKGNREAARVLAFRRVKLAIEHKGVMPDSTPRGIYVATVA